MWRAAVEAARPAACLPGSLAGAAGRTPGGDRLRQGRACPWRPRPQRITAGTARASSYQPADPGARRHRDPGFQALPGAATRSRTSARWRAACAALDLAPALAPDDLLLVLLSGGGSALMSLPARGVTPGEKQALTRRLLACGATIREINCVRKQLSRIKGGRLAQASGGPGGDAGHIRRTGRRPRVDRIRPDGAGPQHSGRRAGDPGAPSNRHARRDTRGPASPPR